MNNTNTTTDVLIKTSESKMPRKAPELLAPAGGKEQLFYALHFGADAVYLAGEHFGLRKRADNFTDADIAEAAELVHKHGKRIFVTVNAVMHPEDIEPLRAYIAEVAAANVDAVIVSDLGALSVVTEVAPDLAVHVSTQASVTNAESARMWHTLGAKRVVLARELSLEEIKDIRRDVPADLELEVFVHGAMCMAHSGRCLISNYLTDRDANRGHCTQPCRWNYSLVEEKRPGEYFAIEEDERGTYLMDSRDMRMLEHINALVDTGIDSLKIEGRMKGAYYVATVVNAYRHVLDGEDPEKWLPELEKVSHRPYSTGFFFGPAKQNYDAASYVQTHDLCAIVNRLEAGRVEVTQRNRFYLGDMLEVLSPKGNVRSFEVKDLRTETGELSDAANRATDIYTFEAPDFELYEDDILRRKRDDALVKG